MRTVLASLACVLLLVFAGAASAQTPTPDATLRAFRIAEKHIREWRLPPDPPPKGPENVDVPKAVGACITLKLRGEVIGRSAAWSDAIAGPEALSSDVLRRAILAAMQQAEPKLGVSNDAMRDAAIKLVTPDILISVELAGPLSMVDFDTWEDAEVTLRPGLDGVAARIVGEAGGKQGTLHAIFPSQMMLGNMLPHRAMGAVASKAIGEGGAAAALDDPKRLREASGVRMYRFRVGQVVQAQSSGKPMLLSRGQLQAEPGVVMALPELRMMASRLAERLRSIGSGCTTDERLLATLAIAQYDSAECNGKGHASDRRNASGTQPATEVLKNEDIATLPTETLALAAIASLNTDPEIRSTFLKSQTLSRINGAKRSSSQQAIVVLADVLVHAEMASRSLCMTYAEGVTAESEKSVQEAFAATSASTLVSTMPWLGFAAVAATGSQAEVPSAIALRRMRSDCWKHQLSITDATEDTLDMTGGIIFTAGDGKGGGNPYPTWQCVRPLAFIATMLRDPRLTEPNERPEQIVRLMQAARFLRQLQVDEASAWMYPDPLLAIGGIRASTWDNSLPVDATSMTLLFVVELIKSLDALSAAQQPSAIAPAAPVADAPKPK